MAVEANVPTVVTTLAVTALTLSTAAVFSARKAKECVGILQNDAQCRQAVARWLNSPQGQRWVAMKNGALDETIPDL